MYCDWPDLTRCCFCLPLRRGVIVLGYLNVAFSACMIGLYSLALNTNARHVPVLYHGTITDQPFQLCIALYCIEIILAVGLLYGAHTKTTSLIRIYYYFAISSIVAALLVQMLEFFTTSTPSSRIVQTLALTFLGFCIQLYLITLIRSLLKKLDCGGPNAYDNKLQQFITGENKIELNGVYNNTTVIPEEV